MAANCYVSPFCEIIEPNGCALTQNVHSALRQTVHAGFDGVLIAYVQLFDLQSPAQSPTRGLHQRLTLTNVPHGGVDCEKNKTTLSCKLNICVMCL